MKNSQQNRREFLKTTSLLSLIASVGILGITNPLFADSSKNSRQSLKNTNSQGQNSKNSAQNGANFAMPKRILGKDNYALEVSALAFGCMGLNYHRSQKLSEKEALIILEQATESGITLYDTAQTYGPNSNEILVGKLLKPYRDRLFITTKFGFGKDASVLDSSPKRIKQVVEMSLKRLNLEQIPLLYQHRFDPKTPIEEVANCVKELIKEGKVARFGVCELSAKTIEKAHQICPITAVQSEYHLMWRNVETELFPTLERLGIGFVAYSPLNRGYLSGKLTENSRFDEKNDNRATFPRFQPEAMRANYQIIELLRDFGKGKMQGQDGAKGDASAAQIAIAYLLAKKPYIVPLFGTTNSSHLSENLGALNVNLSEKDLKELDAKLDKIAIVGDRYPAEQAKRVGQ